MTRLRSGLTLREGRDAGMFEYAVGDEGFIGAEGGVCSQTLTARVDAGAVSVVWPDPVMCFEAANYQQRQYFVMQHADAGRWWWWTGALVGGRRAGSGGRLRVMRAGNDLCAGTADAMRLRA